MEEATPRSLVDDVADALRPILASGMPVFPDYDDERLLGLSCVLERCLDPTNRLNRVKAADELLREVIAAYPSDDMGHAVGLLFGVAQGSRGRTLGKRRGLALSATRLNDEKHFRENIEPKIVRALAWQIVQRTMEPRPSRVVSSEMSEDARQLYRYAQRALVSLEAFDLCTNCAVRLLVIFAEARLAQVDPEDLTHGWLAKYGNKGEDVRLVPASRTDESDQGLWALAYVYRYLRRLLQDRAGRVYVRESLPPESWESIQLRPAFAPDETDKMLSVLEEGQLDSPKVFVNGLCTDVEGRAIHEKWLKLLAAQSVAPDGDEFAALAREETVRDLLMLCIALQDVFPEETLLAPGEDFESAVPSIIYHAAEELGVSLDGGDETAAVSALWDAILEYSPPRYVVDEGGQNREQVWNDKPSIPGVWAGLPVYRASVMLPESEDPEREPHEMRIVVMPGSGLFDWSEP